MIGPNGAGKTTFFNLISGFFPPTAGRIVFDGQDITALPPHQRVQRGMARTFQITEIFPELTVRENLRIAVEVAAGLAPAAVAVARGRRARSRTASTSCSSMGGLAGKADRLVGELSHGDQRATEIMMALALQAAAAAARRADRRHGRPGNLRHHPADPAPAQATRS